MTDCRTHAALLILDAINPFDFEGAEAIIQAAEQASHVIADLRSAADSLSVPVIYVNDNYGHWGSEKAQIVEAAKTASPAANDIVGRLAPRASDYFVIKPHFSGFYATNLTALLDRLEVGRLILTGFAADICVLFTSADAHMRGYDLWVPADAVAAEGSDRKAWALDILAQSMEAETRPAVEFKISAWLNGGRA